MTVNPLPDVRNTHILYIIYSEHNGKLESIFIIIKNIALINLLNILINQTEQYDAKIT